MSYRSDMVHEGLPELIGGMLGSLIFIGGGVFGNCVLWSLAVGTGLSSGLLAGGIFGSVAGIFFGLSTFGSQDARQAASLMLTPVAVVLAIIGVVVWVVKSLITAG